MIGVGLLTRFQAELLLQGKWRGFFLGKYKVLEHLATGGMSNVYLCEHQLLKRRVAAKVPLTRLASFQSVQERFEREIRAAGVLNHPNVVCATDVQQARNTIFLVLEYVDGATLRDIVTRNGPLSVVRAAHYVRQAACGLQHVHDVGIIHRDVKPGTLLLSRTGVVKLFDLGLSRFLDEETGVLTAHDIALGTADYIAPEQALDSHRAGIAADIYSLGGTFYHLLTGRAPFVDGTVDDKLYWQRTRHPPAVDSLRADVPAELAAVLERMMEKDPSWRYPTAAAVAEALAPWTQTPIPAPPDHELPPRRDAARVVPQRLASARWDNRPSITDGTLRPTAS
jgi:serine/threonine protein kinase